MLPLSPDQWAERTFGAANLKDSRRTKRLVQTAADLSAHIGKSLPASCKGEHRNVEGAYRLLENESVDPESIAEAGFQATALAAKESNLILAIQDSTTLGYSHAVRSQLGDLGGPENSKTKGFWAHTVLLVDAETGRTIGPVDQQRWIRDDEQRGKKHQRKQRPYEDKESFKWQKSTEVTQQRLGDQMAHTIDVCDREADVFEYMSYKLEHNQRFIVRASHNRTLIEENQGLFDTLSKAPVLGKYTITVPQRGGRKKRKATLQIKNKRVIIQSPQRLGGRLTPVPVNVVLAEEIVTKEEDKLRWILLTTESINTFDDCRTVLRFYELRWRIEEWHKAWKTGAGVERLRMQSPNNLERMAVILMFVSTRLMQVREALMLPYTNKQKDDQLWNEKTPADLVVSEDEWKVLWITYEMKALPSETPTLKWLFHTIAKLGGWCDSKRTGRPGWLSVWEGWAKLQDRVKTCHVMCQLWAVEM